MSKNELVAKIEALNEWEAIMEEAKVEAEAIRDSIKAEMMERYKAFTKQSQSRRFTISA